MRSSSGTLWEDARLKNIEPQNIVVSLFLHEILDGITNSKAIVGSDTSVKGSCMGVRWKKIMPNNQVVINNSLWSRN